MELRDEYPTFDRNGYLLRRDIRHEQPVVNRKTRAEFESDRPRLSPQGLLSAADKRELERRLVKFGMGG